MAIVKAEPFGSRGRQFHTRVELSLTGIEYYPRFNRGRSNQLRRQHGWILGNLLQDIFQFPGVDGVFVDSYHLSVEVNAPAAWPNQIDTLVQEAVDQLEKNPRSFWPTVRIKPTQNPHLRSFESNIDLSRQRISIFTRPLNGEAYGLDQVGDLGKKLVRGLLAIDGVTEIFIKTQGISVKIAPLFTWDEITPQVIGVFNQALGADVRLA